MGDNLITLSGVITLSVFITLSVVTARLLGVLARWSSRACAVTDSAAFRKRLKTHFLA